VQVVRIGDAVLVGLPFEVTVGSGRLVAEAVRRASAPDGTQPPRVVVSSVANEYAGYVATAPEYARQHYEGGHTLYGPSTAAFLAAHSAALAAAVAGPSPPGHVQDVLARRRFDLRIGRHWPAPVPGAEPAVRSVVAPPTFVDPTRDEDGYWRVEWLDAAPGAIAWHRPLLRVEARDGAAGGWRPATRHGFPVDDQGWFLQVTHLGAGDRYRFVIDTDAATAPLLSEPFG
jgi:neutral ceramidase